MWLRATGGGYLKIRMNLFYSKICSLQFIIKSYLVCRRARLKVLNMKWEREEQKYLADHERKKQFSIQNGGSRYAAAPVTSFLKQASAAEAEAVALEHAGTQVASAAKRSGKMFRRNIAHSKKTVMQLERLASKRIRLEAQKEKVKQKQYIAYHSMCVWSIVDFFSFCFSVLFDY